MKHALIKNFFTKDEIKILKNYCKISHINNDTAFDEKTKNYETRFYKDPLFEYFLSKKKHLVEQKSNLKLSGTYSFWRCYTYGADLPKHKDRPSCEISVSAFIDTDKKGWPIYMDGKAYNLEEGDAVFYKGCEVAHWRETFYGDYHMQAFFHYVDKNGEFKDYKNDERI